MSDFRLHPGSDGVFYLAGELDLLSAEGLERRLASAGEEPHDLVLDLTDVSFVDSTGIRSFLRLAKLVHPRCLVLRAPQPTVAHVLEIVGIQTFGIRVEPASSD
jgi:anti-anti-sigma factor